jgi:uncharacterized protein (TIGR03663 family)
VLAILGRQAREGLANRKNLHGQAIRRLSGFFSSLTRAERWAWGALLLFAVVTRFASLGSRPPHHDEAVHGHFAWELLQHASYRYDPTYHGPLQFFVLAGLFAVFGTRDAVLRSYAAAAGSGLVLVPLLLRRVVGGRAALAMGLLLAVSPTFAYFSRFARNDVPVALYTAVGLALLWAGRGQPKNVLPWAGFFLSLHAVSKETIYVAAVLWAWAACGTALWVGWGKSKRVLFSFWQSHKRELGLAVGVFALVCVVMYTVFFSWPQDLLFPVKAVRYWYEQHSIQRVGGPWYYYLPRLALYEFLLLTCAAAGFWRRRKRLTVAERFLLLWGLGGLATYAYLGEKVPWLLVHQLLPFVPAAGVELAYLLACRRKLLAKAALAAALAATLWSGAAACYLYPTIELDDPHGELLVYVQTTKREQQLAEEGLALYRRNPQRVLAAVEGEGSWPLSWQWKALPVRWSLPGSEPLPPLLVADPGKLEPWKQSSGLTCRVIPLRAWWVERWEGVGVAKVARWFFTREAWSERGSTDIEVCRREEVQP